MIRLQNYLLSLYIKHTLTPEDKERREAQRVVYAIAFSVFAFLIVWLYIIHALGK